MSPLPTTSSSQGNLVPETYRSRYGALRRLSGGIGFIVALLLLSASLAAYGGVAFYVSSLRAQVQQVQQSIDAIIIERNVEEEGRIIALEKRLRSSRELLDSHRYGSQLLKTFSSLVVPSIRVESLTATVLEEPSVVQTSFDIVGPSYTAIARQLVSFRSAPVVVESTFTDFALTEQGDVLTNGIVMFSPSVLSAPEEQALVEEPDTIERSESEEDF